MINIESIKANVNNLKKSLPCLNIDSIFLEQDEKVDKVFYSDECLHELRSCSKLLVAMAVGIAISKEMFSLDTLIYPAIEKIANIKNKKNLEKIKKWKVKDLLTHTTGYEKQMMLATHIKEIDKDKLLDYALNYDIPFDVGNRFAYNNVEPFILAVFFQEKFNINLTDFIKENIFDKLNISEFKWDNYGKYCPGATGLYLKHSDFHKIGKLLLNDGKYNGCQVIPEKWINEMCSNQIEITSTYKPEWVLPKIAAGYYTFISKNGFVFRDGTNGQYIIVNKEKKLLITIMATEEKMKNVIEVFRNVLK